MSTLPQESNPSTPKPDLFADLSALAVNQSFDELTAAVDYCSIPLRKPGKQCFIRVSPDERHRITVAMLELEAATGGDRELFIIHPSVLPDIVDLPSISQRMIILYVMRPENTPALWPIRMPKENSGRKDTWARSALRGCTAGHEGLAKRVSPNMQLGGYIAHVAKAEWPEPVWPDLAMEELLRRAVGDEGVITSATHPAIKALRGEV